MKGLKKERQEGNGGNKMNDKGRDRGGKEGVDNDLQINQVGPSGEKLRGRVSFKGNQRRPYSCGLSH